MLDNPRLIHLAFVTLLVIDLDKLAEKTRLVDNTLVLSVLLIVLLVLNMHIDTCGRGQFLINIAETSNTTI